MFQKRYAASPPLPDHSNQLLQEAKQHYAGSVGSEEFAYMFHRRNTKKPSLELYARFRQSHPEVAPGTSPAIDTSTFSPSTEYFTDAYCQNDIVQLREGSITPVPALPSLSSGPTTASPQNPLPVTPVSSLIKGLTLRNTISDYQDEEHDMFTSKGSNFLAFSSEEVWSDFMVIEPRPPMEHIEPWTLQTPSEAPIPSPDGILMDRPASAAADHFIDVNDNRLDCIDSMVSDVISTTAGAWNKDGSFSPSLEVSVSQEERFCYKLDAPPSLLKESTESAVTYLDKGTHYSLHVEDTSFSPGKKSYCTSVQISFDTEIQRQDPALYWQLWEETRGTNESHSSGGIFRAIEHVTSRKSEVVVGDLQSVHSDGFSLMWNAEAEESKQYTITFQLNFLSTDFSRSKGVNGVAMRLNCKTEEVSQDSLAYPNPWQGTKFCRIKLFRSHGAERKMFNDIANTDRRIERLKQVLVQSRAQKDTRPAKGKRGRPSKSGGERGRRLAKVDEEVSRVRILKLQKDLSSAKSQSFLDQDGLEQENCNWYTMGREQCALSRPSHRIMQSSSGDYRSSITKDMHPMESIHSPNLTEYARPPWNFGSSKTVSTPTQTENWVYASPTVQRNILVACFFVRAFISDTISRSDPFTAIYLSGLTASDLTRRIAVAASIDPARVLRVIWRSAKGINIIVDDDVVANIPEGQDMQFSVTSIEQTEDSGEMSDKGVDDSLEIKLFF